MSAPTRTEAPRLRVVGGEASRGSGGDAEPMATACKRVVDGFTEALAVNGLGVEDRAFLLQSRRGFLRIGGLSPRSVLRQIGGEQ